MTIINLDYLAANPLLPEVQDAMIEAIQKAYYLRAMNPSDPAVLLELAVELDLGQAAFMKDFGSEQTEAELHRQFQLRRDLQVYSFPSLVLQCGSQQVPISHDYRDYRVMLGQILDRL